MYQYTEFDKAFLKERVAQYRDQVSRRLAGALTEEEFKPLRLMNGVYLQLHAYMLRVAAHTLRHAIGCPTARAGRYFRALGQRLWPLHHPAKHPVQLAALG